MSNLNNSYRISLKFSDKDSQQVEVVNLLKQMGRRKSQFITKAIIYYLENEPEAEIPNVKSTGKVNKDSVREMVKEIMQELNFMQTLTPQQQEQIEQSLSTQQVTPPVQQPASAIPIDIQPPNNIVQSTEEEAQFSEDVDALLDGLDMF